jgi:alpha-beta hydrolase superfamily lysophospholipase
MKYMSWIGLLLVGLVIFTFLLRSCGGMKNPPQPVAPPDANGAFQPMPDGTRIFVYTYSPNDDYQRTIYILAGITGINHLREMDTIKALSNGENRIVVIHPRGTGYSDGPRGDVRNFKKILADYLTIINRDDKSGKRFLFGHSMSTAMAVAIAGQVRDLAGTVLVNPPIRRKSSEGMTPTTGEYIKYALYYIFAPHTPIVNMAGDPGRIKNSEERKEAEERGNDPLLVKYFSLYCMMNSKKLMDAMVEKSRRCDTPLLLIYGTADSLVDKSGCDELFAGWKDKRKSYQLIDQGPHGKLTVLKAQADIRDWIKEVIVK